MFTDRNKQSSADLSCVIGFIIPFLLGGYWPVVGLGLHWVPLACRLGVTLCTAIFAVLWWKAPATKAERQWFGVLSAYLTLLLVSATFATGVFRAVRNSARIFVLFAFCLIVARAFRHPATRRAFGMGSLVVSLLLSAYVIACYLKFAGPVFPSYESTRIFKETLLEQQGVSLNPLGFATAFFCILAGCVFRPTTRLNVTLISVITISTVFTGSRTPLALMLLSVFVVVYCELCRRHSVFRWGFLATLPAVLAVVVSYVNTAVDPNKLSAFTEGRTTLWKVAIAKFAERPFTGYGADSWADDLISRTPGASQISGELVEHHAGGYHNAYLTLLAEEGIVVFASAVYLLWFGFRSINRSFRSVPAQNWLRWMYTFAFVFLICRGLIEVPGLFGYGEDPAEFAAYCFVALIVSLDATLASQWKRPVAVAAFRVHRQFVSLEWVR